MDALDAQALQTALERVRLMAESYARKAGLALQPDPAALNYVLRGLARNLVHHGRAYCPCREVTGDVEADKANICPCRSHLEDVGRDGACECGLFVAREYPDGAAERR